MPRIASDDLLRHIVVALAEERDVHTLRQISLLLERENQRLITKNLQLTAELARLRGVPEVAQLTFAVEQTLQQSRAAILDGASAAAPAPATPAAPRPGARRQLLSPISDNYFCRRRVGEGARRRPQRSSVIVVGRVAPVCLGLARLGGVLPSFLLRE